MLRLSPSGRVLDCDERIKGLLDLVPQEIVGTSIYDHLHRNDIPRIVEVRRGANCLSFTAKLQCHRAALQSKNKLLTSIFRFRRKDGEFSPFRAKVAAFRNPLTKKVKTKMSFE